MALPRYIVISCGISLFANGVDSDLRRPLFAHANAKRLDGDDGDGIAVLKAKLHELEAAFPTLSEQEAARQSAEMKCLLGIYGGHIGEEARRDQWVFLHTDTELGERAAETLWRWCLEHGLRQAVLKMLPDLNTGSRRDFHQGLAELVNWLVRTAEEQGWGQGRQRVIFNVAGGFKPFQGYLTILGMLYQAEVVYQFETGEELLTIPPLPGLGNYFEQALRHTFLSDLERFRRIHSELALASEAAGLPETLVTSFEDGSVLLSPWGQLMWERLHPEVYKQRLLPPPDPLVVFTPRFERTAEKFAGLQQMMKINSQIDELARFLRRRQRQPGAEPLAKLHLRPLRGDRRPSSHEIAAWDDKDAERIFFHWDDQGRAVLDEVGAHL